jgi:hypothetical protein
MAKGNMENNQKNHIKRILNEATLPRESTSMYKIGYFDIIIKPAPFKNNQQKL